LADFRLTARRSKWQEADATVKAGHGEQYNGRLNSRPSGQIHFKVCLQIVDLHLALD
jgi:hypothetical protein